MVKLLSYIYLERSEFTFNMKDLILSLSNINTLIGVIFTVFYVYQIFFILVPFIKKQAKYSAKKNHSYAVLISARNEEAVISNLIESIKNQTYSSELVDIYVVADNCTDSTADVARKAGATVYERNNDILVGKGYALDFLLEKIEYSKPECKYDGFFVFDADNVLNKHYIEEMNKVFSNGHRIVTGYRNSKNYGTNWISSGYALWFIRESKYLNNSRMLCNTSCAIGGTGFLVHREVLLNSDGWKFFFLTEDIQFTVHNILEGESIAYCNDAVLYDEQPTTFAQSWKQRMRWAKGFLQVAKKYNIKLLIGSLTKSFACYDMLVTVGLAYTLSFLGILGNLAFLISSILSSNTQYMLMSLQSIISAVVSPYIMLFVIGGVTLITEWKKIVATTFEKILSLFTFPLFMMTYIPISIAALFKRVEWEPIHHNVSKTVEELEQR